MKHTGERCSVDVFEQVVAKTHVGIVAHQRGDLAGGAHAGFEFVEFFPSDQRALLGFHPGVFAGDNPEAVQNVDICTEIGDAVSHVKIESSDHAHHGDQRRYRQDDAKQSQETPQLMGTKGIEREPQRLQHGDQRAPETALLQGHLCPRRHARDCTKPFDG